MGQLFFLGKVWDNWQAIIQIITKNALSLVSLVHLYVVWKMFGIRDQKLQLTEADVTTCDVADLCVILDHWWQDYRDQIQKRKIYKGTKLKNTNQQNSN